jgi:hypothetical protein
MFETNKSSIATKKIGVVQNVKLAHFTTTDNQLC